jgi:hypothetical protein
LVCQQAEIDNLFCIAIGDNIVDRSGPCGQEEDLSNYTKRLTAKFQADFPRSHFSDLEPGQFDKWSLESLKLAQ